MKSSEIGAVSFFCCELLYNVQGARMATDENLNLQIQSTIFSVALFIWNALKLRSSLFF